MVIKLVKRLKKKSQKNRRLIYRVATLSFKDNIMKVAENRSDGVVKSVLGRTYTV